jgi:polyisoprenoid-binding protein YceI
MLSPERKQTDELLSEGCILPQMINMTEPYPQSVAVRYVIDSRVSRFTVQAFAGGLFSALGHNPVIAIPEFSGEAQIPEDLDQASLALTINASSLKVVSDMNEKDRIEIARVMHERVLETGSYPEIIYNCSHVSASKTGEGQYWMALNGDLTLHGVTRGVNVPARVTLSGDTLKASGNFSILQSDYEIELVSVAGGTLKVKDELKCSFEVVAKRQE